MPTIMDLFKSKELNFPGGSTADGLVDSAAEENRGGFGQQVKNFAQQELRGIRVKSLVEINNPLIYGNQAVRIAQRTTPDKDTMSDARRPSDAGDGGGLNLNQKISAVRDTVNSKLGIPETYLPTRVIGKPGVQKLKSNQPVNKGAYGENGNELGKLLKNAAGNPSTLGKQVVGGALNTAKQGLRGAIFGKPGTLESATGADRGFESYTNNEEKYSETYSEVGGYGKKSTDIKDKMGIDKPGLHKPGPAAFSIPEKDDDKLQIPFWIQDVTSTNPDDRVFFRTVITGLTESSTPTWTGSKFIGNPYNYYIYEGVDRSVTFNLNIYCTSSSELLFNWKKIQFLTSKVYPKIQDNIMNAPFIKFQLGDIYKNRIGFIETLTYTMPDNGTWENDSKKTRLPKFIDVSMTIKLVETPGVEDKLYDFDGTIDGVKDPLPTIPPKMYEPAPIAAPTLPLNVNRG